MSHSYPYEATHVHGTHHNPVYVTTRKEMALVISSSHYSYPFPRTQPFLSREMNFLCRIRGVPISMGTEADFLIS